MTDDFTSLAWARHHRSSSAAIHQLITSIGQVFATLETQRFAAPWRRPSRRRRGLA